MIESFKVLEAYWEFFFKITPNWAILQEFDFFIIKLPILQLEFTSLHNADYVLPTGVIKFNIIYLFYYFGHQINDF